MYELVSNAGKYTYPNRPGGLIWVRVSLQTDKEAIAISVGLPPGFDPTAIKRLGTRLVNLVVLPVALPIPSHVS